ncbi:39S ribosomal protein L21, mitochondrial [Venturia canescens]|uniref:39S ribosomal protein L21, mitochondrial n=1 Tax=Venturia canescens TaxID=32260 RepID=UPI001C9BEDD6|nr:39S ribosomal protein L21, mitochondrial [Venturia canescens]
MAALFGLSRTIGIVANNCLKRVNPGLFAKHRFTHPQPLSRSFAGPIRYGLPWIPKIPDHQTEVEDTTIVDDKLTEDVVNAVNNQVSTGTTSRLFAVVHICGKQFKVTDNDLIVIQGYWPPMPGDQLKLEKVLLVGSTDFTLVGRPLLNRELVSVDATVIEKTFSNTKTRFRMRARKQYKRIHFYRIPHTMVRINSIRINGNIDDKKEVEGLDRVY